MTCQQRQLRGICTLQCIAPLYKRIWIVIPMLQIKYSISVILKCEKLNNVLKRNLIRKQGFKAFSLVIQQNVYFSQLHTIIHTTIFKYPTTQNLIANSSIIKMLSKLPVWAIKMILMSKKNKQVNKHNKIIHRCAQIPHNSILFT